MVKAIFNINLRGIDVRDFKMNPIVWRDWSYQDIVGRAKILPQKRQVEVEFSPGFEEKWLDHITVGECVVGYAVQKSSLLSLATIPMIKD